MVFKYADFTAIKCYAVRRSVLLFFLQTYHATELLVNCTGVTICLSRPIQNLVFGSPIFDQVDFTQILPLSVMTLQIDPVKVIHQ